MFGLFEGAEARRLPRHFHVPWKWMLLAAIVLIGIVGIAYGVNWVVSRDTSAPAAPVAERPAAQPFDLSTSLRVQGKPVQPAPVVVAPTATLLTLRWEEYDWEKNPLGIGEYYRWGKDEKGVIYSAGDVGGIRGGEFIGTGTTRDAIVYIRDAGMIGGSSREDPLEFSPDGERWFRATNLPKQGAQIRGAVWDGDDILILANWAYEPWKYRHYIARTAPEDTKRASQ